MPLECPYCDGEYHNLGVHVLQTHEKPTHDLEQTVSDETLAKMRRSRGPYSLSADEVYEKAPQQFTLRQLDGLLDEQISQPTLKKRLNALVEDGRMKVIELTKPYYYIKQ
ncbi:hypothetical protein ACFPYI_06910 [Halomarina salina]|uniref:C2H2-type domain-containing protein n=1 Tax=Halomarina salina TaxID=1872699 RepID=A0ABD5RKL7_9EURY|nr:hypothetical protein [Halomarina salina]